MSKQIKYIIIAAVIILGVVVVFIILSSNAKKKRQEEDEEAEQDLEDYNHENPEVANCVAKGPDCIPYTEGMKDTDTRALQNACNSWLLVPFATFLRWECTNTGKSKLPQIGQCVHLNEKHEVKHDSVKYDAYKPC